MTSSMQCDGDTLRGDSAMMNSLNFSDRDFLQVNVFQTPLELELVRRLERHVDNQRSLTELLDVLGEMYPESYGDDAFDALVELYDERKDELRTLDSIIDERDRLLEQLDSLESDLDVALKHLKFAEEEVLMAQRELDSVRAPD
jgi:hypothetical protein